MDKQSCVYILASGRAGTLYTGVTSDLPGRLHQHREGVTKGFAHRYRALKLVWHEVHDEMASAIIREKRIKGWRRDWKLNLIEAANPQWVDLAIGLGFEPLSTKKMDSRLCGNDGVYL